MSKRFYFISGLPRSGSTVISCILNQNPRFYSGLSSPVLEMMSGMENIIFSEEFYKTNPKPEQTKNIISSIIHQFYSDIENPIIFDKNRGWSNNIKFIETYIEKNIKIICPVRDVSEILSSFVLLMKENTLKNHANIFDEEIKVNNQPITTETRCDLLMKDDGVVRRSLNCIQSAFDSGLNHHLCLVEYQDLIKNPKETFKKIYNFLEEEYFEHDFENISQFQIENDLEVYGLENLHKVRSKLKSTSPDPRMILTPDILLRCKDMEFWRTI